MMTSVDNLLIHASSHNDGISNCNPLTDRATRDDFIDFIYNESVHKSQAGLILSSMNGISFLYIDPNNNENTNINTHPTISKQLIKETYPDIYEQLLQGHKVIIAWMMGTHKPHCADGVCVCDFIESRINHNLASILHYMQLMLHTMNTASCEYIPDGITNPLESVFWYGRMAEFAVGLKGDEFENIIKNELSQLFITNVDDIYVCMLGVIDYFEFVERVNKNCDGVSGSDFGNPCTIYLAEQYLELFNWDTTDINIEEYAKDIAKHIRTMQKKC